MEPAVENSDQPENGGPCPGLIRDGTMITPITVQTLIEMIPHDAMDHSIMRRDMIASAGSYRRRAPGNIGQGTAP